MLSAHDFEGVYGILPTPAKEGADRWDATDTVDLDETARLTEKLIADGCSGLLALGTTGECATLTGDEFEAFADCLLSTVGKRVPVLVGATALGTHETVRRMKFLRDRGADGTMLGLPMWQPCSEAQAVKFYASISEAFSDMAIMVYANQHAFRFRSRSRSGVRLSRRRRRSPARSSPTPPPTWSAWRRRSARSTSCRSTRWRSCSLSWHRTP